ncbi:MAG: SDR family NAD(P)-dependent oxidoreductase [Steroidobacteraceae bacterium]
MSRQERRVAIVTGASRGLGAHITMALAVAGVDVLMVGRDRAALARVAGLAKGAAKLHPLVCELEASDAVDTIISAVSDLGGADILINNAAIQGPIGPVWEIDFAAFERTIQLDFLLPVALSRAVVPAMLARGAGWIVNISGGGATAPRPMFSAYGAAKTALVRFAETLAAETADKGVRVNSIAPGAFASGMTQDIIGVGQAAGAAELANAERLLTDRDDTAAQKTAELVAYLVTGPGRSVTGKLISTLWDPWSEMHQHWNDISGNDVYTLRRIVPADRKLAW